MIFKDVYSEKRNNHYFSIKYARWYISYKVIKVLRRQPTHKIDYVLKRLQMYSCFCQCFLPVSYLNLHKNCSMICSLKISTKYIFVGLTTNRTLFFWLDIFYADKAFFVQQVVVIAKCSYFPHFFCVTYLITNTLSNGAWIIGDKKLLSLIFTSILHHVISLLFFLILHCCL